MIYLLLCLVATQALYTNRQALECFEEKAVVQCKQQMDLCTQFECREELEKYSKCSFGSSTAELEHVFNGNCFSKWRKEAVSSKEVIDCLADVCNLEYNSQIGLIELFQCTEWVMVQDKADCGLECMEQLSSRIRSNFYTSTIVDLFSQKFNNEKAQQLADSIKKECIQNGGRGRAMLEEEQRARAEQDRAQDGTTRITNDRQHQL